MKESKTIFVKFALYMAVLYSDGSGEDEGSSVCTQRTLRLDPPLICTF